MTVSSLRSFLLRGYSCFHWCKFAVFIKPAPKMNTLMKAEGKVLALQTQLFLNNWVGAEQTSSNISLGIRTLCGQQGSLKYWRNIMSRNYHDKCCASDDRLLLQLAPTATTPITTKRQNKVWLFMTENSHPYQLPTDFEA